mmetsp:Transcript_1078/g.2307  ORF Transcript_1078/g.2307 Transcript_1078/m.2307 type:complete len:498 (+) Transcript_1078:207-1700(+)
MLRHNTTSSSVHVDGSGLTIAESPTDYDNAKSKSSPLVSKAYLMAFCVASMFIAFSLHNNLLTADVSASNVATAATKPETRKPGIDRSLEHKAFETVINRTRDFQEHCTSIGLPTDNKKEPLMINNHSAHLPQFGFLDAFSNYQDTDPYEIDNKYPYKCELPPETECGETQFTVIFMAYNPDRLQKLLRQIKKMLTDDDFSKILAEVVIVWNGVRHVDETSLGAELVELGKTLPLRISYPLKAGFPNDLMNRYHPRLEVKTKAIMYYDDDGPFYSYQATLGGFELWKRNSNAQIGAMARKLDLGPRQAEESNGISKLPNDRFFVSQCPSDTLNYNYFTFTNFDARMVLPSGSFLHSNYLCFLWHPIFEDIRKYIRQHPVNPDDGTVSMLVSQLAGRAPKVYPRRINPAEKRRRLMDGINWDAPGAHDKKMNWGALRTDVANSLARYFGSVNSGSLGWCYGTEYQTKNKKENNCNPEMAKVGMLPWMNEDHTAGDVCV